MLEALADWNFWNRDLPTGIERDDYLVRVDSFFKSNVILAITGVRRAGKSVLMRQIARRKISSGVNRENVLFVNFEDSRLDTSSLELLDEIFSVYKKVVKPKGSVFVFLDEVHKVAQWQRWVRTFHELGRGKVIISGSCADLLGGEISNIYPLDWKASGFDCLSPLF